MAAGLGFKTFATGEVLSAANVNGYLMQGILVFATEAARNAAITVPAEGQFAFTKDTNSTWYYDGAAWVASGASGDVTGITVSNGIAGTSLTGPVPALTLATTAKGDLLAGTGSNTAQALTVGANDTVLTADSTTATGLKWAAAAAGGGMTLLSTTTLSGASTTISGISGSYKNLKAFIYGVTNATADGNFGINPNSNATLTYNVWSRGATLNNSAADSMWLNYFNTYLPLRTSANNSWSLEIADYASTVNLKNLIYYGGYRTSVNLYPTIGYGIIDTTSAITSLVFFNAGGSFLTGTVVLYGVN